MAAITATPLLLLSLLTAAQGDPPENSGIHAIVAVDGRSRIRGVDTNATLVTERLKSIREFKIDVTVDELNQNRVSPGEIVARIRALDPNKVATQTLIFYYAGHGATDPQRGHFLQTSFGSLFRSTLVAEIMAKKPKLAIVITDCCSTVCIAKQASAPAPFASQERVIRNLLLQHKGLVDINGSTFFSDAPFGQVALYDSVGTNGGIFTTAFDAMLSPWGDEAQKPDPTRREPNVRDFDLDEDGFLTWDEAFEFLSVKTADNYRGLREWLIDPAFAGNRPVAVADPRELARIRSQLSQDPQVFGELVIRSDLPVRPPLPPLVPRPRFGVTVRQLAGGGVMVQDVTRDMPATRVRVTRNGVEEPNTVEMVRGDIILRVNGRRVRTVDEFLRRVNEVPDGGTLILTGEETDPRTGEPREYTAKAVLGP